ncbi:hypothetical protein HPULCUR_004473 [Helicostylum pulchrum]|uniref:TLDc domain-containing protein n=1 Tax=Helicostylum pulchrum TaxID=562976 RepID=A0ABP9XWB0_9FUNG
MRRLDEETANLSESLFFQSLSVLPIDNDKTTKEEEEEEEPVIVERPDDRTPSPKGYSLADLGVDFSDLDFNTEDPSKVKKDTDDDDDDGSKILNRDLIELFVLLLWLGEVDQPSHDFNRIRELATFIVTKIKPSNTTSTDELPCVSYDLFSHWKNSFSPHLFKPLQSFITKSFGYYNPTDDETEPRLLPQDKVPEPDTSDILTPLYSTLLSWALPETILITKQWTRLYSADQDGFSMNRFESHVFKYPGPTLFIMQVEETQHQRSMILGAFITQSWKHSKHFWGSEQCFLFELDPNYDLFRPVVNKHAKYDHYIYYHHDFGIGFGATQGQLPPQPDAFILSLQNTLQQGQYTNKAYPSQPTFELATEARRSVDFKYKFDTENIEVFGLGNEKDRERQAREWKFDQNEAERRSGLNIRKGDGELDKELLKLAGIIDEDNRQDR